jgi:gliding motility-associated-like protein
MKYYIYYTPSLDGDFYILDSTMQANDTTYVHSKLPSIAACYAITAIDSAGNQGEFSNLECVSIDSCSIYELPNVFTPNDDGFNDYLRPFPYTSVEKIDLNIFNRYGTPVFKTNNPDIEWDGRDRVTNAKCSEGVYFYVCDVYEITLEGLRKRTLKGSIHLYR